MQCLFYSSTTKPHDYSSKNSYSRIINNNFASDKTVFFTDKTEASRLSSYGQRESPAGCSLSFPHLSAHQKETQVNTHIYTIFFNISESSIITINTFVSYLCVSCRVDTEEWMATVEVLLSKSSEACQWMVQYLVGPEGREITRSVFVNQLLKPHHTSCFSI